MAKKESKAIKLMKEYKDINNERTKALTVIEDFKKQHSDIFDTLESLEYEVELLDEKMKNLVPEIKDNMASEELKKHEEANLRFTYVAPTIKRNFDTKKFYEDYSPKTKMYKTYVTESDVSDYVKIKELVWKDEEEQ